MLASASRRGDGIVRIHDGTFVGDGTAVVLTLGFIPTFFRLINQTDVITYEKIRSQVAANSIKTIAAGTMTLDNTSGILFNADGTVTISAAVNVTAKSFAWVAQ